MATQQIEPDDRAGQPWHFHRRNWEIKLHQWEHKFQNRFYRPPTLKELNAQLEQIANVIVNPESSSDYQCGECDWGTVEVKPRDFVISESAGRKVYWRLGGDRQALTVWSEATCLDRLLTVEQTPAALEAFMEEARQRLGRQPDKMHTLWAMDCYERLSNVYNQLRTRHMPQRSLRLVSDTSHTNKGEPETWETHTHTGAVLQALS